MGVLGYSCDGEWYPRLFAEVDDDYFPNERRNLWGMFAAYEHFVAGEPLSNGTHVEIGTDLEGGARIGIADPVGRMRAWGVRDNATRKVLLWVDNAQHTWANVSDGTPVPPASGTLTVPGLRAGQSYRVVWWDPYASDPAEMVTGAESVVAQPDGSLALAVNDLRRDVALKITEQHSFSHAYYLPLVMSEY
jgi:hypothetical protein